MLFNNLDMIKNINIYLAFQILKNTAQQLSSVAHNFSKKFNPNSLCA